MNLNESNLGTSNKVKNNKTDIKAEKENFIFNDNNINGNKENKNINIINKNNNSINNKNIDVFENKKRIPIKPKILKQIKYGIDENGNPMNIEEYFKNINNNMNKKKRPIAYIVEDKNNDNILVDLNGNKITEKNKEGDYELPFHFKILIKDFDVKHPELRINGERLYSLEENTKIEITDNSKEKDEKNKDYNNITDEVSLQIDSTETDENTSQKIYKNVNKLNCIYKNNNIFKEKYFIDLWKLRYGNNHTVNNTINNKQTNRITKVRNINNKRVCKNYSYHKIRKDNNQEYVTRTSSILNINKQIDDNYSNNKNNYSNIKNLTFTNLSNSESTNYKNILNKYKAKDIITDYIFSPIKKLNKENVSTIKNHNIYKKNVIIKERIIRPNIPNNMNYISQKKYKKCLLKIPINNSNKKYEPFSNSIKSPSLENKKRKSKKIFKEFNHNDKHYFYSYTNSNNNSNKYNRIKNHIINKNIIINLDNEKNKEKNKKEKLNYINDDLISKTINKCLSRDNINNNTENNIYKKEVKTKNNIMVPSSIRSFEYSESNNNELNFINKIDTNENKIDDKYIINKRNKINKCKLIKKIPVLPKNQNQNFYTENSILTKEANNMIRNYLSKKKIKNRKCILKISFLKNQIINKSFSTKRNDKINHSKVFKGLFIN